MMTIIIGGGGGGAVNTVYSCYIVPLLSTTLTYFQNIVWFEKRKYNEGIQ